DAGLEPEQRAPIKNQVEFDITPATIALEILVGLGPGRVLATLDNGAVGVQITVSQGLHQGKAGVEVARVEVVEEQAAHAAGLLSMLEVEVLVTVLFHTRIDFITEGFAGVPGCLVPVSAIFLEAVIGRQVAATAEPPHRLF